MKQRIRKIFCTVAASAVVMLSPSFAAAAAPKKFTPYSPTGESCPAPNADQASGWINPAFDVPAKDQQRVLAALEMMIGRDKPDGYFVERSTQSVNELRLLMRGAPFRDSMTAQDYADAQDLLAASRRDMADRKKQSIEQAAALRLASNRTGLSVDAIAKTAGEVDDRTWLHMIRSYGHDIGLGFYADQIDAALRVANPVMLEEIIFLKRHPRLPVMLSALHLQKSILPPAPAQGIAVSADEQIAADIGSELTFEEVLAVGNGSDLKVGIPLVSGASVKATVVAHGKHDKVRIFKLRRRKHYQKHQGHRQAYTELQIGAIAA